MDGVIAQDRAIAQSTQRFPSVHATNRYQHPAAWRDLNCDGKVSFAEWLRGGIDFRLRPSQAAPGCQEIYAVKTGAAMALHCAEPPVCRVARDLAK